MALSSGMVNFTLYTHIVDLHGTYMIILNTLTYKHTMYVYD